MVEKPCRDCGEMKSYWPSKATYCKDCTKRRNNEWRRRTGFDRARDKLRAHDPAHKAKVSRYRKQKRREDPATRGREVASSRRVRLLRGYGLTVAQLEVMREAQGGVCAICRQGNTRVRLGRRTDLCVDHDHATGKVRGLLCSHCNSGLGHFRDSIEALQRAIEYLQRQG